MPSHAAIAGTLLNEAAAFFRNLAERNEPIREQMIQNAGIFEQVASVFVKDPAGIIGDTTHVEMAIKLLRDTAAFFRTLAAENEQIRTQMIQNAAAYEKAANLIEKDPSGTMP